MTRLDELARDARVVANITSAEAFNRIIQGLKYPYPGYVARVKMTWLEKIETHNKELRANADWSGMPETPKERMARVLRELAERIELIHSREVLYFEYSDLSDDARGIVEGK